MGQLRKKNTMTVIVCSVASKIATSKEIDDVCDYQTMEMFNSKEKQNLRTECFLYSNSEQSGLNTLKYIRTCDNLLTVITYRLILSLVGIRIVSKRITSINPQTIEFEL